MRLNPKVLQIFSSLQAQLVHQKELLSHILASSMIPLISDIDYRTLKKILSACQYHYIIVSGWYLVISVRLIMVLLLSYQVTVFLLKLHFKQLLSMLARRFMESQRCLSNYSRNSIPIRISIKSVL